MRTAPAGDGTARAHCTDEKPEAEPRLELQPAWFGMVSHTVSVAHVCTFLLPEDQLGVRVSVSVNAGNC